METEVVSIAEFMRQLVPSGQLPRHTRELVRVLEDFGVEVKLPSRARACLAAHTGRETFLTEGGPFTVNGEEFTGRRFLPMPHGGIYRMKEYKASVQSSEEVAGPGLQAAIERIEQDEYACNEGLAFLAVDVADDGGFVANTEKRSL